jgi:HEAT repeat protein
MSRRHAKPQPLAQALLHLRDMEHPFPPVELYYFSALADKDLAQLEAVWPDVPVERRRSVVHDLNEIGEVNFEVTFEAVFRFALDDEDSEVRATAIRGLWESEELDLVAPFIAFFSGDPSIEVRAAAATALGKFVYLGELEEAPTPLLRRVEEALLTCVQGADDLDVRRRALEALGYSSRREVPALIEAGYQSKEDRMRVSAVFAMSRTFDAERWAEAVLAELDNGVAEIRFEAARAAGELQLADAVFSLKPFVSDEDQQLREAAIWSLSQIGGPEARRVLTERMEETDDEAELEFLDEALENLDFTDDVERFALMSDGFEGDDELLLDDDDDDDVSQLN